MEPKVFLNTKISVNCGCRETEGKKFGIELELEGRGVGLQDVAVRGWNRHADGSLRGEAIEYTTAGAKSFEDCEKSVKDIFKKFKDNGVRFKNSIRTSTHVHLNFSDKTAKQAINFFALFTLLEEVLQYYSGEDRKGNLFCISSREAEGIVGVLAKDIGNGHFATFAGDRYKYAACNLSTLYKFGTIEVRTMRGANTAEIVNNWLSILNDMYNYSCDRMVSPAGLVVRLSELGAEGLMREIFSPANLRELLSTFPSIQTLHYSLMEGARLIQVFAYEYEEAFTANVDLKDLAPKGRGKEGSLPRLTNQGGFPAIWRPDRQIWNVQGETNVGEFWLDGERVVDDPRIYWSEARQRFCINMLGRVVTCRWAVHDRLGDEGRPALAQRMPARQEEPEEENDWEVDEGDDDF